MNESARSVAEDAAREANAWSPAALLWRMGLNADADANAYADADAYANADAYADADAADADAADADAYAYANAAKRATIKRLADGMVECLARVPSAV